MPILLLALSLIAPVRADVADTIDQINSRLQRYEGKTLSPEEEQAKNDYSEVLTALQDQKAQLEKVAALRQELVEQPRQISALKQKQQQDTQAEKPLPPLEKLGNDELQQRLTLTKASLLEQQKARDQLEQDIAHAEKQQLALQQQLAELKPALENGAAPTASSGSETAQMLYEARLEARNLRKQALELELLTLPGRAELHRMQLEQLNTAIAHNESDQEKLESAIRTRLRSQTEEALSDLRSREQRDSNPIVQQANEQNIRLSEQMHDTLSAIERTDHQRRQLEQHLKAVDEAYRTISQQLELEIRYVGTELHRLQASLMQRLKTDTTRARINELRLENLQLSRDLISTEQQLGGDGSPRIADLPAQALPRYRQALNERIELIGQLRDAHLNLISELSTLLSVQANINERTAQARDLIGRKLLWLPSVAPVGLDWFDEIARSLPLLAERWRQREDAPLLRYSAGLTLTATGLCALTLAALLLYFYQKRRMPLWKQQIGNVIQDRFWNPIRLLLFAPLIAAPLPLLLVIVATQALNPDHPAYLSLRPVLLAAATTIWVVHSLRLWLAPGAGLFISHLGLEPGLARSLRQRLLSLLLICGPLLLLLIVMSHTPLISITVKSGLERLLMLVLTGCITLLWGSLLPSAPLINRLTSSRRWWSQAEIWLVALVISNLIMMGLMLTGYVFTAQVLMLQLLLVLLACLAVFIYYRLGIRWLLIAERRLTFDRALARRAEIQAAREKNEEEPPVKTDYLDIQTISEQSRKLLATLSLLLLFLLLWLILRDFMPALDILDRLVLWSSLDNTVEGDFLTEVTLKDLLFGLLWLGLSIFAASNLPGLLELILLRHLTLSPGTGYAITTLIKYLLIVIGILVSTNTLGLQWSKLQWLVAALGVGLGFGLQEIVANFVSGLIILFEKPVRIGDTVTIGGVSGTVTRIQIRSTTIVDWDRKEVIIPNKTFITDQLINWSLTDPTTRVVIPIGIAYGSDTDRARALMIEAARDTERVLDEPAPEAFFVGFGASTLDLELRLFVSAMADRLEVTHRVNTAIACKFRAAGLEIAFPQLDVHLYPADGSTTALKPQQGES
ncbi:mechanosensitive ion channel domain-containing protein [Marinobacterium aestuariivivens]|uniref:Mechanosensitive ion channel domain-containing protein n=1 Tax=Marinobacterium aestuariivivens TaxID=1698799 RepID=A0ABW1ZYF5_9GAMM